MPTNSSGTNLDSFAGPKGKRSEDVYKSSPMEGLWRVAEKTSRSNRDFEEMQSQVALTLSETK